MCVVWSYMRIAVKLSLQPTVFCNRLPLNILSCASQLTGGWRVGEISLIKPYRELWASKGSKKPQEKWTHPNTSPPAYLCSSKGYVKPNQIWNDAMQCDAIRCENNPPISLHYVVRKCCNLNFHSLIVMSTWKCDELAGTYSTSTSAISFYVIIWIKFKVTLFSIEHRASHQ